MIGLTPEELEILRLSLKVAFWSTLASLPVALALAMLLARGRFPGKALVDGLVNLPLVLPPVVMGTSCCLRSAAAAPSARCWRKPSASCSPFAGPARRSPVR